MLDKLLSIFLFLQIVIFPGFADLQEDEASIRQRLLKDYDKTLSPVLFQRKSTYSDFWLSVLRIRGLDESKGVFILEGILFTVWSDERLDFESDTLKYIQVSSDDVWVPHANILNRVEREEMTLKTRVFLLQNVVGWGPRYVLRTSCIPNLKFFPFDKHTCKVIVVSITDEGDVFPSNYTKPEYTVRQTVYTRFMIENNLWRLVSTHTESQKMDVDIDTKGYGGVFSFEIERTMPLIAVGLLCPCLVSMILLLTTFWMQAGASTRTGVSVTSILVSAGNLFTIAKILPVSGATTPIMVQYITCALVLSTISTLHSTLMSVMSRCKIQPPLSYTAILEKLPRWTLYLLAIEPITDGEVDHSFLFSKLVESDNVQQSDTERNSTTNTVTEAPWGKHIILFDRLMFYLFGLVLCLLIVSILFTE